MDFKKSFRKQRYHIYLTVILAIFSCLYFIDSMIYPRAFFHLFSIACGILAIDFAIVRRYQKKTAGVNPFQGVSKEELRSLFDKYTRRSVNWMLLALLVIFGMILDCMSLRVNSKADEMLTLFLGNLFMLEVVTFSLAKNLLLVKWINQNCHFEHKGKFCRELKKILLISVLYWILAGILFYLFEEIFVLNISAFVSGLFVVGIVIYNFTRIHVFTYSRKKYNKMVIAVILIIAVVSGGYTYLSRDIWLTQPYINATPYLYEGDSKIDYDEASGVFTITKQGEEDFKILQLTDIHLGGGVLSVDKDLKALKAVYALLKETKPDLVIVTGDLTYPVGISSFSFNNTEPVQQFAAFMRNTGIPWAFTYGNHDTESYAATSESDLNALYKALSWNTSRTLLYPYVQPDITGRNNQLIEIRNADGSLNQGIFLIDSNAYTGKGLNKYDYIHDDQVAWYKEQVLRLNQAAQTTVSSLVFFHIPLQQYKTA